MLHLVPLFWQSGFNALDRVDALEVPGGARPTGLTITTVTGLIRVLADRPRKRPMKQAGEMKNWRRN